MIPFKFFDRKMVAMTLVGEEVNKLDVIYEQLSSQYSTELDVSMYLPIFQLGLNIGGP
jgi:hypothetical protein